jgi:hypothetical protein
MFKFDLGSKVKDCITDFEGIVIGRTEWISGCNRYGVKSRILKDGLPQDDQWFDENMMVLVEEKAVKEGDRRTGGPADSPRRNKDPKFLGMFLGLRAQESKGKI